MGYRIREIREEKGMSQTELSEKTGLTRATIWRLETGKEETTTTKTLLKIAEALNVSVGELFLATTV